MAANQLPIPAFLNPHSGSAAAIRDLLAGDRRFSVQELPADQLRRVLIELRGTGTARVLVAGGDGTVALAAGVLAGSGVALAVLPGGTLNHFAQRIGVPEDLRAALELAVSGDVRPVDVGYVNQRLFLNTSSVGSYARFVRLRERLERSTNYRVASVLAGLRVLLRLQSIYLELQGQALRTPLVFIGVQERETLLPALGGCKPGGRRGLHTVVVHRDTRLGVLGLALKALWRGVDGLAQDGRLESLVLERFELRSRHRRVFVATDGEIERLTSPLAYRFAADALRVVGAAGV